MEDRKEPSEAYKKGQAIAQTVIDMAQGYVDKIKEIDKDKEVRREQEQTKTSIGYICNRNKCDNCNHKCKYTLDVEYANNFYKEKDCYIERRKTKTATDLFNEKIISLLDNYNITTLAELEEVIEHSSINYNDKRRTK